ncbi:MAG: DUF1295 domain-containing protein [Bacteroidota bacterium]
MADPYIFSAVIVLCYVIFWFIVAQVIKDNGIMDVAWGLGFVLISWAVYFNFGYPSGLLIPIIVTIYGLRLSVHIFVRNLGKGEDWRYANWRREWGKTVVIRAFFQVFLLQGCCMWIIALPLLPVENNASNTYLFFLPYVGLVLWLIGFLWESIADWQLLSFKQRPNNREKILTSGLWAYSRHPNYFGEVTLWWGIFLLSLPHSTWWIAILGPLLITFLISRVSGVPMLEAKYRDNPRYQEYVANTNALIPKISRLFRTQGVYNQ